MFFTIKSDTTSRKVARARAKFGMYLVLNTYQFTVTEAKLEELLRKQYKQSLKPLCHKIIENAHFSTNYIGEIIVTIPDPFLNEMAMLITYGNGKILGCPILHKVFGSQH